MTIDTRHPSMDWEAFEQRLLGTLLHRSIAKVSYSFPFDETEWRHRVDPGLVFFCDDGTEIFCFWDTGFRTSGVAALTDSESRLAAPSVSTRFSDLVDVSLHGRWSEILPFDVSLVYVHWKCESYFGGHYLFPETVEMMSTKGKRLVLTTFKSEGGNENGLCVLFGAQEAEAYGVRLLAEDHELILAALGSRD